MRTIRQAIIGAVVLLLTSAIHTFAIEGIQVSVQSSNVLLSWPSATNETYIVQSMGTLQATDMWLTLTDGFPAAVNTNLTVFIESNAVQPPVWITNASGGGGTNDGGGMTPPGGTNDSPGMFGSTTGFYRVVRDGLHIFGLTNGAVLSGNVQQPIEFAVNTTDAIAGVTFYDTNENPLIGATATPGPNGGWIFDWDTTMSANGNYAIQAEVDFEDTNSVVSVPVTVTVSNLISFPNYLTQLYGSQMWNYAQTVPSADVEIDIYDENTNYLGSFYPVSDGSGVISFLWNLTDGDGDTFPDTNFFGIFTVYDGSEVQPAGKLKTLGGGQNFFSAGSPSFQKLQTSRIRPAAGGSSSGSAIQLWTQEPPWTPNNYWVIGVGDIGSQVAQMAVYGGPSDDSSIYGGIYGTLHGLGANMAPGNTVGGVWDNEYFVNDPFTRSNLLAYLASPSPRYENFFWFGHGTNSLISAYESGTAITASQISYALGNVPLSNPTYSLIKKIALHPYRFVWMEACDTAAGNICESFGVPAQNLSTNDFVAAGLKSTTYLGYKNEIAFNSSYDEGSPTSWDQQSIMWNIFLSNYLNGNLSLAADVNFAINNQGPFFQKTQFSMGASATSYGATDLIYPGPF